MSALPIAANLPFALYVPLLLLVGAYAVIAIVTGVRRGRGQGEGNERLHDIGFALVLAAAAWTVILLVLSIVSYPGRLFTALGIILVIAVFFTLLLLVLWGLVDMLVSRMGRGGQR
ncbi:MAG TPA: hypothetical protein VEQ61_05570 [Thermoleophilaceae bacterium]|nr:hypothetical protein [Thermoleophilaceae bacterium]